MRDLRQAFEMKTRESRIRRAEYRFITALAVVFGMAIAIFLQLTIATIGIQVFVALSIVAFYGLELLWASR